MKHLVMGIVAHVDAGKTTLSEAMLYTSGSIRKMGRVDKKDAFLDTYELERARGITIFSKQAVFSLEDIQVTLLDTPGHVDFCAEMERTLQVLDYAVLVISGTDGIQGHTHTLWRLLKKYKIPVFLFINKMDLPGAHRETLISALKEGLDMGCIDFLEDRTEDFYENVALCEEAALEQFLKYNVVEQENIRRMIKQRKVFPCFFGSALKAEGVEAFLRGLWQYVCCDTYPFEFGAKVYQIARDAQGNRLAHMKITGGSLKVKDVLGQGQEKVNQIRIYSGEKYEVVTEAAAGSICAVTGVNLIRPGEGLGVEPASAVPVLEPVLTCQIKLPPECQPSVILQRLWQLEEEDPQLHIIWNEESKEIQAQIMGEVQIEILKSLILERFEVKVEFGAGSIVYKETIENTVEGIGHFEPLKHYAEVHLRLEPLEPGSGIQVETDCSVDELEQNWQKLILSHLREKEHRGVLTGAVVTDMKVTLVAGRAHKKHTEGGDFRQAAYRAVRQGLKQADSVLLEPFYEFRLAVPKQNIGRAMSDVEKMCGSFEAPFDQGEMAVLTGSAPAANMHSYQTQVTAYTSGKGMLSYTLKGYEPCHNAEEMIEKAGYDSERDIENPTGSIFCSHGAGFAVNWDEVEKYMHLEKRTVTAADTMLVQAANKNQVRSQMPAPGDIKTEEIEQILAGISGANRRNKPVLPKRNTVVTASFASPVARQKKSEKEYLLVDGYNIIFAWEELKELAQVNMDGARGRLLDILCNYQAIQKCSLIVVFDAYRVEGHVTEFIDYHNIHVVFTREKETADLYIEKFAHENGRKYHVTVATSDGLEQMIIRGQGCSLLSARDLREEIFRTDIKIMEEYQRNQSVERSGLFDRLSEEEVKKIRDISEE